MASLWYANITELCLSSTNKNHLNPSCRQRWPKIKTTYINQEIRWQTSNFYRHVRFVYLYVDCFLTRKAWRMRTRNSELAYWSYSHNSSLYPAQAKPFILSNHNYLSISSSSTAVSIDLEYFANTKHLAVLQFYFLSLEMTLFIQNTIILHKTTHNKWSRS